MSSNQSTVAESDEVRAGSGTRRRGARHRFRTALAGAAVLAAGLGMAALPATSASATASFDDGTWVVAAASFDCGAHEVSVLPTTNEPLTGNFTVYYVAWVYDEATGGWRSAPSWTVADGITAQTFDDITTPDATGYIEYGHMDNGTWVTTWDTVTISDGIDDAPPFC